MMDAWLSGFADGEGCFLIAENPGKRFAPRFKISLRADDKPILDALRNEFGGFVGTVKQGPRNDHPSVQWVVSSKHDLARLRDYFEQHPLRAKKARDYAIWSEAVRAYCARGGRAPELADLRDALAAVRTFDSTFDHHDPHGQRPEVEAALMKLFGAEGG